eukprot:1461733-Rhodomonas_salina.3
MSASDMCIAGTQTAELTGFVVDLERVRGKLAMLDLELFPPCGCHRRDGLVKLSPHALFALSNVLAVRTLRLAHRPRQRRCSSRKF